MELWHGEIAQYRAQDILHRIERKWYCVLSTSARTISKTLIEILWSYFYFLLTLHGANDNFNAGGAFIDIRTKFFMYMMFRS